MSIIRWQYGLADPEGPVPLVAQAIPQPLVPIQGQGADEFLDGLSNPSMTRHLLSLVFGSWPGRDGDDGYRNNVRNVVVIKK